MNDFLQNLRGSSQKEKRTPKTRRSFDHGNQYNAAPGFQSHGNYQGARASNVKKPATRATLHTHMTGGDHQPPHLSIEPADIMVELMDIYTKNQDLLINVQERRVKVEERKAIALEKIAEYIRVTTSSSTLKELLVLDGEISGVSTDDSSGNSSEESSKYAVQKAGFEKELSKAETPLEPALELSYNSVDGDGASLSENKIASRETVKKIREKSAERMEAGTALFHTDDFFQAENKAASKFEEKEAQEALLRKRANENVEQKISVGKASKKVSADFGNQPAKAIKHKNPQEKIEKEAVFSKDKNAVREGLLPREEIMAIIHSMRKKGSTFDQVAQHLVELGQPTFSGRGDWHAQTIHRLCNKKEEKKKQ